MLLEKEREAHHKVCGEFLSREAVDYLHQAGVDPLQLGAAEINMSAAAAGVPLGIRVNAFCPTAITRQSRKWFVKDGLRIRMTRQ